MPETIIEDKNFNSKNYSEIPLVKGIYENCTFSSCNFTESNLSHISFEECFFEDCDLSLAVINNTAFRDVRFTNCKMLGLHFENCQTFRLAINFNECQLNYTSFHNLDLRRFNFTSCQLQEVDFTESNISKVTLDNCNLAAAIFFHTNLSKTDFRSSYNFSIDPEMNKISHAKFSINGLTGLLDKYDIEVE